MNPGRAAGEKAGPANRVPQARLEGSPEPTKDKALVVLAQKLEIVRSRAVLQAPSMGAVVMAAARIRRVVVQPAAQRTEAGP
jgi:hypothetical protein